MRSLYLGRAFGIPLYIHWSFFLLPLYALFANRGAQVQTILLVQAVLFTMFGCILLHELGHALMARTFQIRTRDITLYPIGGVARLESMGRGAFQEVCIALAGPAVNVVIVLVLAPLLVGLFFFSGAVRPTDPLAGDGDPWGIALTYLAGVCAGNAFILAFNLLPAFPMDGGRVLRALLSVPLGLIPATAVAAGIGAVLAVGMAVVGLTASWASPSLVLVGGFVVFAGQMELASLRRLEAHRRQEEQRRLSPAPVELLVRGGDPLDPSVPLRPDGVPEPAEPPHRGGFTGFLWDTERKVWVCWENGRRSDLF